MNTLYLKLALLYFTYFSLLGVMVPYLGLYLDSKDFNLLEISQLLSLLMVTKVVAPLIWGGLSDRYSNNVFLVRFGSLMTLVCYLGFFFADGFWAYCLVIILFSFFWNAVLPQIEVVTLYNLAERKDLYSRIRLWGSIGFILSVMCVGLLFDRVGISYFPVVLLLVIASIFLTSLFHFGEPQRSSVSSGTPKRFASYFKRPGVANFFIVCFLLQVSHGAYYTYFTIYLESLGYSTAQVGFLWSLGVIAEVLLFVYMHRWMSVHSIRVIMIISLVFTSARWVVTASFAENWLLVALVQCLHALSFGAMHATAIKYVHLNFDLNHQGKAQALYSGLGFGAGGAFGAYLSGIVVSTQGYMLAFMFSALAAFIAVFFSFSIRSTAPDSLSE